MTAKNIQFTKIEIKAVKYIFKHFKDRYNARQLARILGLNHAHLNKLCNLLVAKQLLKREEIGNAAYFSFDYKNKLAIKFIEYLLSVEEKEVPKWLAIVAYNLKKFNEHIQCGLIFGSSIKNKEYNDIDVLLIYNKNKRKEIRKIKEEIRKSQLVEKPIRYADLTEKDIHTNKNNKIVYNMISDNLIVYNAEKYVKMIKKCQK